MSIPTEDDAVELYQSQVPRLRSIFARHLRELHLENERREKLFTTDYENAVFRAAEEEVENRTLLAAECIRDAMDAGYRPDENSIQQVLSRCFSPRHYEQNSLTDIRESISELTAKRGRPPNPELEMRFEQLIGRTQVTSSEQSVAKLKMHLRILTRDSTGPTTTSAGKGSDTLMARESKLSKEIFITHGRSRDAREAVGRFIYEVGLVPIILEDEPNAGLTIIEKFEKFANVSYAIAILSPDDVGCLVEDSPDGLKPRARQNAIFELGYMFAKIGRDRVAVILPDLTLERPTNIDGIAWIPFDANDGWKHKLRKEFRSAGHELKN